MNFLAISTSDITIIGVILVVVLVILFIISFRKDGKNDVSGAGKKFQVENTNIRLKEKFMFQKELKVFDILEKNFSNKFIVVPKVFMKQIINPRASREFYDMISEKVVDFVIFDRVSLRPALAVDVYDNSMGDEAIKDIEKNLVVAFKAISLPMVSIQIKDTIVESEIVSQVSGFLAPQITNLDANTDIMLKNATETLKKGEGILLTVDQLKRAESILQNVDQLKKK